MSHILYAVISLSIAVCLIVGAYILTTKLKYTETDKTLCALNHMDVQGKCGLFNDGICWKGNVNGLECVKPANYGILSLFILAGLFIIAFIVFLILGILHKDKSVNAFSFGRSCRYS